MSGSYRVAPIFLIRMAGVPFEVLSQLASVRTTAAARELLARQNQLATAREAAERFVGSRESGLSAEESRAFRARLHDPRTGDEAAGKLAVLNEFVERSAAANAADVRLDQEF